MIFCMKCGSKLPDEARFCKYCGTSTEVDGGTASGSIQAKPSGKIPTEENDVIEGSVKSRTVKAFEDSRKKPNGIYLDNEYHCGLARKNIGGEYNGSQDEVEGGKWGFVDGSKKEIIPVIFDHVSIFKDGYAKVTLNGKCGFLNKKGEEIIPLIYDDTTPVSDGLAGVCMDGKWGFVDTKGKKVIPLKYNAVVPFENGTYRVCKNGKWGLIDKKDRIIIPFMYNDISQFDNRKKANTRTDMIDAAPHSRFYNWTLGIGKAWAAFFGEVVLLLVMNYMLPDERNSTFWSLAGITVVVSFVLFFIIIDTIKEASSESKINK